MLNSKTELATNTAYIEQLSLKIPHIVVHEYI